jgi:predicted DNA binding CopG/RHH family protein
MEYKCKKTSYSTEQFALEHIAIISKKTKREQSPKSAYLCKHCNTWHITKQESIASLKKELEEKDLLLKARAEEIHKLRINLKEIESKRNNSLGTNEFQVKVRILEKELIEVKAKSAKKGIKFNDISVKINTIKNIVNKGIKKQLTLEQFIDKIKEKL